MKKIIIGFLILGVAGCSSVGELRNTKPALTGQSNKSVSLYSACVLEEWNKQTYLQPMIVQPLPQGYSYQFNDPLRGTVIILDVTENDKGSKFTLYKSRDVDIYEKSVSECK